MHKAGGNSSTACIVVGSVEFTLTTRRQKPMVKNLVSMWTIIFRISGEGSQSQRLALRGAAQLLSSKQPNSAHCAEGTACIPFAGGYSVCLGFEM